MSLMPVDGVGHTGGGVRGLQLDLHVGVHGVVALDELLHQGGDRGGTGDSDRAGSAVALKGLHVGHGDVVLRHNGLALSAHDVIHKVLGGLIGQLSPLVATLKGRDTV